MSTEQYIVFKLDEGEYGISIMNIREIIPYKSPTFVPDTPEFVEGLLNHRDSVIPVINLKERLNLNNYEVTNDSRIIIITIDDKDVGFLVDEASQTLVLKAEDIEESPSYATDIDKKYIMGVAKLPDDALLILMDLEEILSYKELDELKNME